MTKFSRSSKRWITRFLLALTTGLLCFVVSPILATETPIKTVTRYKVGLQLAVKTNSPDSIANLIQQGKTFYEAGRYAEAVNMLEQAATAFKSSGDDLKLAMTLSNLSLAYQQLGQWNQAEDAIAQSLDLLQNNTDISTEQSQVLAQSLDVRGRLQWSRGQAQAAFDSWQEAASTYASVDDRAGEIKSRINQAQALQALGLYRQAQKTLIEVKQTLQNQPNSPLKATGLRSLGNVLRVVGDLKASRQVLEQSLTVAKAVKSPDAIAETLFALGNTARNQQETKAALEFYQQAAIAAPSSTIRIQAQLQQLSLLLDNQQFNTVRALLPKIQSEIESLPLGRIAVYAKVDLAQNLMRFRENEAFDEREIASLLVGASEGAKTLGDERATSFALGNLGKLYERAEQWSDAIALTQQALLTAQRIDAEDIGYRWQWQLGRLLEQQGDIQGAIAAYSEAVNILQSLRRDLVAINPDIQFSFREEVEPVYRELVDLLLKSQRNAEPSQKNLIKARQTIESLQLAELDNFFREACLDTRIVLDRVIDKEDRTAAVIYPIILPDRLEVILKLPQQQLRRYSTPVAQSQVENVLDELRQSLIEPDTDKNAQSLSQQVYTWLLLSFAEDLAREQIETLVFVLDGSLRSIPMAALYDGQQYLVEKYNIALTPSLQLIDPQRLERERLNALVAGLSQSRFGFAPLTNVEKELKQIQSEVPSRKLLDREFTSEALQNQINSQPFSVVHIATHGQFSSDPDRTFILAWDKPIKVNELNDLLRTREQRQDQAIELLVLSACETATGDKRAALGLAGVAVRAGARSTLASLWNVADASTALLMSQFYQELANNQTNPAQALRLAQIALLKNPQYQSPMFWAAYVLVGNWL
jgi:CHAT domain-containing protein/tetratricopeptide (TPR) repeat protein